MIKLYLKLLSPILLSANRNDNILESLDYIPGSVLRGALASSFLKSKYNKDNLFETIFLSGKVRFGNCYLGTDEVSVLPATARSCKTFSGFKDSDAPPDRPKHGVLDGLIRYYLFQKHLPEYPKNKKFLEHLDECKLCGFPVDQFSGVYAWHERKEKYLRFENKKSVITRTALDEYTQSAKKGALFSVEVLQPHPNWDFHGKIFTDDPGIEKKLSDFILDSYFTLGAERTYGYGQVEVLDASPVTPVNDMESRLDNFNNKLKQISPDETGCYFVLTFNADVILYDKFLRFVTRLDETVLKKYHPTDLEFCLEESYSFSKIVPGWNNIHKLPKENNLAIEKGAVFLFKLVDEFDKQKLITYLTKIENEGIGERKIEGFGEVKVNNPFHLKEEPI